MGCAREDVERDMRGMNELYVLLEEHAAIRAMLGALRRAGPLGVGPLLDKLEWLVLRIHVPKEDQVVLERLRGAAAPQPGWLPALQQERREANDALRRAAARRRGPAPAAPPAGDDVEDVLRRLAAVLDAEEATAFPALYGRCSHDDRWCIAIELDRAVDVCGREDRERALAECWR